MKKKWEKMHKPPSPYILLEMRTLSKHTIRIWVLLGI